MVTTMSKAEQIAEAERRRRTLSGAIPANERQLAMAVTDDDPDEKPRDHSVVVRALQAARLLPRGRS